MWVACHIGIPEKSNVFQETSEAIAVFEGLPNSIVRDLNWKYTNKY